MLTSRSKRIILLILEAEGYITIQQIADDVNVSSRTILRELDDVQKWIEEQGGVLDKKKGKGLSVLSDSELKAQMIKKLYVEKSEVVYTPEERKIILKAELLKYSEATKLFTLTKLLDVTESTIATDLLQLESWFMQYGLEIIRRPGLGILLDGDEIAKRKAIVALIYEHFHVVDLIELISDYKSGQEEVNIATFKRYINASILALLHLDSLQYIKDLLVRLESEMGYYFADNAYIALTIRFSITLKRSEFWGRIHLEEERQERIQKDKVYVFLKQWVKESEGNPFIALPDTELQYLTMHIKGSKLRETSDVTKISMIEDFRVIQLAKDFIQKAEYETGIYLSDNEELLIGLVKHLRPAIYRMKMNLDIINPLVQEIKVMYPELFQAISQCVGVIEKRENVQVPEDEIAYLATHIGAVIHKSHRELVKKYNVYVACMYGIGASQLLLSQLEKQFNNIEIKEVVSVIDDIGAQLKNKDVDLLISTVPIKHVDIPYVVVDAILKDEDIVNIKEALKHSAPHSSGYHKTNLPMIKDRYVALNIYSQIILEIINNFSCDDHLRVESITELIDYVSRLLAQDEEERIVLEKSFAEREEKGSTILSKKGMMLLHCRADIERGVCVNVLRLQEPIMIEKHRGLISIRTIVVMVGPVILNQRVLEILSEISHTIISSNMADTIIEGSESEIQEELHRVLDKFFQRQVLNG